MLIHQIKKKTGHYGNVPLIHKFSPAIGWCILPHRNCIPDHRGGLHL